MNLPDSFYRAEQDYLYNTPYDEVHRCSICECTLTDDNMSECEDDYYCEECYELFQNEELMECEKCKAKSKEDGLYEYDGRKLCEECYEEIMDEKADAIPFMELLKYVNQLPDEVMRYALQKILKAEWNREDPSETAQGTE